MLPLPPSHQSYLGLLNPRFCLVINYIHFNYKALCKIYTNSLKLRFFVTNKFDIHFRLKALRRSKRKKTGVRWIRWWRNLAVYSFGGSVKKKSNVITLVSYISVNKSYYLFYHFQKKTAVVTGFANLEAS